MANEQERMALTEKLRTQAETGLGRTMARPDGPPAGVVVPPGGASLAGSDTNDAMPGGGAVGGHVMPDTVVPGTVAPGAGA